MMSFGFTAHMSSSVKPLRSHVPPLEDSKKMSVSFSMSSSTCLPPGVNWFSCTERQLRRSAWAAFFASRTVSP